MLKFLVVVAACGLSVSSAVEISGCAPDRGMHNQSNDISLSSCKEDSKYCELKRKSTVNLKLKFTPRENVEKLINSVHAILVGIPFPFIGVDGKSICDKIYNAADESKAECPLKAGQEYIYKDAFDVKEIYPKVRMTVQWALTYGDNKKLLCFEVPAKITSGN